jgi:hypothetical protein
LGGFRCFPAITREFISVIMAEKNQCLFITYVKFFLFIVLSLGLGEIHFKVLSWDLQIYLFHFSGYSPHSTKTVTSFFLPLDWNLVGSLITVQTGLITIRGIQTPVKNLWGAKKGTVATTHGVQVFAKAKAVISNQAYFLPIQSSVDIRNCF